MLHINLNKMTCWFISDQFCPLTWLQIKLWARHDTWYFLIFSLWFLYIDLSATFIASFYSCSHQWHHRNFAGLNLASQIGLSRLPGEGRYPNTSSGHGGTSGITILLLHIHYMLEPIIQTHGFSFHCYADDTQLYFSFQPGDLTSCTDLRLPGRHFGKDERTSPAAQPSKDWASRLPWHSDGTAQFHHTARIINNNPTEFSFG